MVAQVNPPKLTRLPTKILEGLPPLRCAIYGEGGVGKTTFALSFPNPLVIDTDGGLEGDAVVGVNGEEWRPDTWLDLNALYFWLKDQIEKRGYETIVLDSISELAILILHEAMAIPTKSRTAALENSELIGAEKQDYGKVAYALDSFLTRLKLMSKAQNVHVVITSGVRDIDLDASPPRPRRSFDVQAAVENALTYWANIYGEYVVTEEPVAPGSKELVEVRVLWTSVNDRKRKNKTRFGQLRPGVKNPTFAKIAGLITNESE